MPSYNYTNLDPLHDAKWLTHVWGEVMIPNSSPLFTSNIKDRKETFRCKLSYGQEPIALATRNLMLIRASYAVAFGSGTKVLQGMMWEKSLLGPTVCKPSTHACCEAMEPT